MNKKMDFGDDTEIWKRGTTSMVIREIKLKDTNFKQSDWQKLK
jgi:hypothetical protein